MKFPLSAIILFVFSSFLFGQKQSEPNCELQDLAISAALGDTLSQHDLGVVFFRNEDYGKAAAMWRLSSNGGDVSSFNNLGYLTYYGKGVKQDYAEGIRLWRVAAEKGFPESQIHLATAYSDNRHLKPDYIEAYAWAKTGKYFARQIEDAEIIKMADARLIEVRKGLSGSQLALAEKKATEYIAKFAPKKI
jgi:hypothetical protein